MVGAIQAGAEDDRLRWTSVPRWPIASQGTALPAAASYLACWFGGGGERRARALLAEASPDVPVRTADFAAAWDTQTEGQLKKLLGECVSGVRIILAGPEALVLRAAADAREQGAVSEELVLIAVDATGEYAGGRTARRVFCAACRAPFGAVAALGETADCPGCGASLIVDRRFSRPHAAYFGWPTGLDLHR